MWKLGMTLAIVLLTARAICAGANTSCLKAVKEKGDIFIQHIIKASSHAAKKIDKFIRDSDKSNPSKTLQRRFKPGVTGFRLTNDSIGFELKYNTEINDSNCRRFLRNFAREPIHNCRDILQRLMSTDKEKILAIADTSMKILDKMKKQFDNNNITDDAENMCNDKIGYVNSVGEATIHFILEVLHRAQKRLENFPKEFSYCLIAQVEFNPWFFDEWHKACSYYTNE